MARQEQLDNPGFTDWDRWCADEYLRLAAEEGDELEEENDNNSRASEPAVDEVAGNSRGPGVAL